MDFLSNAEKVTSFNLSAKDFESLQYKREIQFLFTKHFFPDLNPNEFLNKLDTNSLNGLINKLKAMNPGAFQKLHKYNIKGLGPGEVLMYYMLNNAYLGGGSSKGLDIVIDNGTGYELKAVDIYKGKYAINFKVGGTFDMSDIIAKAMELKEKAGASGEGVNTKAQELISSKFPKEWKEVVEMFKERSYENYFRHHSIIFIRNTTKAMGEILAIKAVKKDDIDLHVITSGTIKPQILL